MKKEKPSYNSWMDRINGCRSYNELSLLSSIYATERFTGTEHLLIVEHFLNKLTYLRKELENL
jgi:hypothetical protein